MILLRLSDLEGFASPEVRFSSYSSFKPWDPAEDHPPYSLLQLGVLGLGVQGAPRPFSFSDSHA